MEDEKINLIGYDNIVNSPSILLVVYIVMVRIGTMQRNDKVKTEKFSHSSRYSPPSHI